MDTAQGLSIIMSAGAVVIAAVAAFYAAWQAFVAHGSMQQAKDLYRDQNQAYVFADIRADEHEPQLAVLVVKNEGPTVATNITVSFEPPISANLHRGSINIDQWLIPSLPPGARLVRGLGVGFEFFPANEFVCVITVTGTGRHGALDRLAYAIDLPAIGNTLAAHKTTSHIAGTLEKIAKTLLATDKKLGEISTHLKPPPQADSGPLAPSSVGADEAVPL
ncbi:hypothetical protein ACFQZ4_54110 [Catellatospora coxensis]|uniref:hypothetical protein n=1 Tax=Catellatospora coxensis TaxID=310354 RepID=UPI0019447A92|nr:hypothetical protein [Catellatospora coxensis]